MKYNDLYQQYLNYYNNPEQYDAPNVSIASPQQAPSQGDAMVAQGAGLAGKGAGIYAGGKLGGSLFGGNAASGIGADLAGKASGVGASSVGTGSGASASGAGAGGKLGLSSAVGTVAPLAAVAHGLYTGGKFLSGDKLNTGEKLAYALPTAGLSLFSDSLQGLFGSGKSKEQKARESTRGMLAELGLLRDDDGQGYLAEFEGQDPYLMGFSGDFNNQDRSIRDLAKVLAKDAQGMNQNRNSWDIDYTSDLDFMTNLASEGLGGLLTGGNMNDSQKQVFRELTNASLADTDREFNQENWANTIGDIRSLYEKAGFTDANMANQRLEELVNQGLEQQQADQLRQGIGLVYGDNSFGLANDLNAGRWNGIEQDFVTRPLTTEDLAGALLK